MPAAIITAGALWGRAFVPWQRGTSTARSVQGASWVGAGAEKNRSLPIGSVERRPPGRRRKT